MHPQAAVARVRHVGRASSSQSDAPAARSSSSPCWCVRLPFKSLRIVQAYLGADSASTLPSTYFAFIPLILLVMLLPVTFNGIGTSQAAFVWFFARAGVPAPAAFALSVLFVALGIVGNLPGGILYAVGHSGRSVDRMTSSLG
jgi:hypothetical protein